MPIDILLLLDVSGSTGAHLQRIADAAEQALNVLAEQDRIAIMVFDARTRESSYLLQTAAATLPRN